MTPFQHMEIIREESEVKEDGGHTVDAETAVIAAQSAANIDSLVRLLREKSAFWMQMAETSDTDTLRQRAECWALGLGYAATEASKIAASARNQPFGEFDAEDFGRRVRTRCAELHVSHRRGAELAHVSVATFCRVCNGREPDIRTYFRLLNFLGTEQREASPHTPSQAQR